MSPKAAKHRSNSNLIINNHCSLFKKDKTQSNNY